MFLPRWDSKGWTPANNQRNTYSCWVLPSPLSPKIPLLPWAWASVNEQCHLEIAHPPAPRPRFPILGPLVCFRAVYLCWVESYTDRAEAHLVQDPQPDRLKMEHTCLEQANKADFAWIQIQVSGDTVQSHQPGLVQNTENGGKLPAATNLTCKSMMFYQVKLALWQGCMFKLPQKWDDLPSPPPPPSWSTYHCRWWWGEPILHQLVLLSAYPMDLASSSHSWAFCGIKQCVLPSCALSLASLLKERDSSFFNSPFSSGVAGPMH